MSVLVKNAHTGAIRPVATSAVPMLAPGGWQPLSDDEIAAYQKQQAADRAAREASLTPGSPRPVAASVPAPAAEVDSAEAPKRSGAKRRQDNPENTQGES